MDKSKREKRARQSSNREGSAKRRRVSGSRSLGPCQPSLRTVKRLFAVSGNRCAFPSCESPVIDQKSGSVIAEICHIKGERDGAARFDKRQSNAERQDFANLILMCGTHHKIIDDDPATHTSARLIKLKSNHEKAGTTRLTLNDDQASRLIEGTASINVTNGSNIAVRHQSGGQVAHTINNFGDSRQSNEEVILEASLMLRSLLRAADRTASSTTIITYWLCPIFRPANTPLRQRFGSGIQELTRSGRLSSALIDVYDHVASKLVCRNEDLRERSLCH